MCEPAHTRDYRKCASRESMRIVSARRAPTGVPKADHAPALRHRRSFSSATRALVGGQIAEAVAFGWVCRRLAATVVWLRV